MIKRIIKNMISQNYYINNWIYDNFSANKKKEFALYVRKMSSWDCIMDTNDLEIFRYTIDDGRNYLLHSPNKANTHIYGIWENIFGGIVGKEYYNSPSVEHGLILHDDVFDDLLCTSRASVCTLGPFRKSIIRKYLREPVFCVGPYIHYALPFYEKEKQKKLKEKLGKVLLVFPVHSTDASILSIKEEKFIEILNKRAKEYDNVLINTYWWNINDTLIKKLRAEGYHICSAGFRDDPKFLNRLKSIINLADYAIGDSVGTHVGYCMHENVPFEYIEMDSESVSNNSKEMLSLQDRALHVAKIKEAFSGKDYEKQKSIYKYYFGGGMEKTDEELKAICNITKELFRYTKGNKFLINYGVKKLLKKYENNKDYNYEILKESIID